MKLLGFALLALTLALEANAQCQCGDGDSPGLVKCIGDEMQAMIEKKLLNVIDPPKCGDETAANEGPERLICQECVTQYNAAKSDLESVSGLLADCVDMDEMMEVVEEKKKCVKDNFVQGCNRPNLPPPFIRSLIAQKMKSKCPFMDEDEEGGDQGGFPPRPTGGLFGGIASVLGRRFAPQPGVGGCDFKEKMKTIKDAMAGQYPSIGALKDCMMSHKSEICDVMKLKREELQDSCLNQYGGCTEDNVIGGMIELPKCKQNTAKGSDALANKCKCIAEKLNINADFCSCN